MKTVLIGLLQSLGGWLAVSAVMSWILQWQYGVSAVDTIGMSLFGGAFAWVSFGLFVSSAGCWRQRAAILGGVAGKPPKDNRQVVLAGTIQPIGSRLQAPLDGSVCVMYSYEIHYDAGQGKRRSIVNVARGIALTPSRIVNKSGSYKLLSVPILEAGTPTLSNDERIERFLQYARRTTFIKKDGAANELLAQWADDDGAYRSDVAYGPLEGAETRHWVANQTHVPVGESICVFGLYSKAKGGIIPSAMTPTRLICGGVAEVAAKLKRQAVTRGLIGLVLVSPLVIAFVVNR